MRQNTPEEDNSFCFLFVLWAFCGDEMPDYKRPRNVCESQKYAGKALYLFP